MSREGLKVRLASGKRVSLPAKAFVAAGGEGSIYAHEGVAYKIYDDPARAIGPGKLAELRRIANPAVLTPRELLVSEADGAPIGYAMPFLAGAWTLTQLVPSAFWARQGLCSEDARGIAVRLAAAISAVHAAGCCVGDLSGTNVLVVPGSLEAFLVDTDSFQTPGFGATAITPEIRDPLAQAGRFSPGSDWFAFAVLVFELLTGMHPYKGRHPRVRGLSERMRLGICALDREVGKPAAWRGIAGLPGAWVEWLRGVLEGRDRSAPSWLEAATSTSTSSSTFGLEVSVTLTDGLALKVTVDRASGVVRFSGGRAFVPPTLAIAPSGMVVVGAHVILHVDDRLLRLDPVVIGERVFMGVVPIASVMPHATRLWPGLAISDVVGRAHAHLIDAQGQARATWLPELDGSVVVDAAYDGREIVAVVLEGARRKPRQGASEPARCARARTLRVARPAG